MPPSAAVSAVLDIIGGLDAAQAAGILHRDIKPSNCFVDADGDVKVGDFGLSISTLTRDVRHELGTAGFEGTPDFAAPEQLRGEPLDVRADIYAVGATLYYLLTGRPPLDAPDFRELVSKVASEKPPSPRVLRRDIPRGLAAVVLRCLAKAPAGRPQSYAELADLLRPYGSVDEVAFSARGAPHRVDRRLGDRLDHDLAAHILGVDGRNDARIRATLLGLSAWSWLVPVIYYFVLEGGWGASLGKRLMGLRVTSQTPSESNARWWLRVGSAHRGIPCAHSLLHGRLECAASRLAVAAVDPSAVLDRPPWQRMDRRPRAAEPHACRAAERQARRIRRSEGVTCRSCSRPFVFATRRTVRRAHDRRRDRRRTFAHRDRSDPSPSCLDSRSSARNTAGRGRTA